MAIVTITFTDVNGGVDMKVDFDPSLPENPDDISAAQTAAAITLERIKDLFGEAQ